MNSQQGGLSYQGTAPEACVEAWDRCQQAIIRSVAHEIRSTLASVSVSAESLATAPDSPPPTVRRHTEAIGEHAQHISRLLDDLVALTSDQLERSRVGVVEINEIIWEAAQQLWRLARQRCVRFEIPSVSEPLMVPGKRSYLVQAVRGCLECGVLNLPEDSQVSVRVEPQTGVDAATAVEILVEYQSRADDNQDLRGGSGRLWEQVTMQAIRRIVEAHRGAVDKLGDGRDGVRLLLPRHRAAVARQARPSAIAADDQDSEPEWTAAECA